MNKTKRTINAIIAIAFRDVLKFLHDRMRIVMSMIFPIIFIGVLGGTSQSGLGAVSGKDLLTFTFLGVIAQTLFQSTASGIISLINDRDNDFSQELFVSPISRYAIIVGKIIGESTISFIQVLGVIAFGFILGVKLSLAVLAILLPVALLAAMLGGSFGVLVLGNFANERTANQLFPFIMFPQIFLGGVFTPTGNVSGLLYVLTRITPLTYATDLVRGMYKVVYPSAPIDTIFPIWVDVVVMSSMVVVFLVLGTMLFVKKERNK